MNKKIRVCSLISLIFLLFSNTIQASEDPAKWITIADFEHQANQWFNLRKTIDLESVPKKAKMKVAVDSKYWLWVNGHLIIYEGMLKRGPNPNDTYYDEIDLANHLQQGSNTIAVLVWYFGNEGFSHNDSKKIGFYIDG